MIKDKLWTIAEAIQKNPSSQQGLLVGSMGEAIFFAHLFNTYEQEEHLAYCNQLIENSFKKMSQGITSYTHSNGLTGIAAGITYLIQMGLIEEDPEELLSVIDQQLHQFAIRNYVNNNWDFLHGALGATNYFLNHPNWQNKTPFIKEHISNLERLAEMTHQGMRWQKLAMSPEQKDKKEYSFGLSHGIPGIIATLLKAYKKNIEKDTCKRLIDGALQYMLANRLPENNLATFPGILTDDNKDPIPSRLAWCYGDLSISLIFLDVAHTFNDKELEQLALDMAYKCSERKWENSGVADAGFCHGAAGVAYLFHLLFKTTKLEKFKEAKNYWIDKVLQLSVHPDGFAGYKTFYPQKGWENTTSLLEGLSGIGLVLLDMEKEDMKDFNWDTFFLLS